MRTYWVVGFLTIMLLLTQSNETAFAPDGVQDIQVPRLRTNVTLDGAMAAYEWSDAVEIQVIFRFFNATTWELLDNRTGFI